MGLAKYEEDIRISIGERADENKKLISISSNTSTNKSRPLPRKNPLKKPKKELEIVHNKKIGYLKINYITNQAELYFTQPLNQLRCSWLLHKQWRYNDIKKCWYRRRKKLDMDFVDLITTI